MKNLLTFFLRICYTLNFLPYFLSSPVFGERKRLSLFAAKDSAITNNNKIHTFWLFLKYMLSWEIKALKQYPLITKVVWIVLEAISKTRTSCLTGVSRHLGTMMDEIMKALRLRPRTFICFLVSWNPGQTLAPVFDILHQTSRSQRRCLRNLSEKFW